MPFEVEALVVDDTRGHLHRGKVLRRDCQPEDVVIDIHYTGICHSDYSAVKAEWGGPRRYPFVPGHEIAGIVEEVGANVTKFSVGDKVGIGCIVDSCRECHQCEAGFEQYCVEGMSGNYNSPVTEVQKTKNHVGDYTKGGYSQKLVVAEKYVLNIPDEIPFELSAPLLCAGISMYSPLTFFADTNTPSEYHVAIAGLGGLGDIGVKIAKAMGFKVTAISSSEKKREYAENVLGVDYVNAGRTPESQALMGKELAQTFDLIICTIAAEFDLRSYTQTLKTGGKYCFVGAPAKPFDVAAFDLIGRRITLCGTFIGGIKETQDMLNFCAKHGIWSEAEIIDASEVNRAYTELGLGNNKKNRFIIKIKETLTSDGDWTVDTSTLKDQKPHLVSQGAQIIGAEDTAGKRYKPDQDIFVSEDQ